MADCSAGPDWTSGSGRDCLLGKLRCTAEELEAIAVTLLRAAEVIRNREEGAIECVGGAFRATALEGK